MIGSGCAKHWAKTQTAMSLSSGEAELHGIATGCAQALGIQSSMRDMGWHANIVIHNDATAAIGIARRKGLGEIRHLDVTDLWIQDNIGSKIIQVAKVLGTENLADVLTKYVDRSSLEAAMGRMQMSRPAAAQQWLPKLWMHEADHG